MAAPCSFNYGAFVAAYPEFANCSEPQLQNYFDMSDAWFSNDTCNPAFGAGVDRMTRLAYLLTAHLAWLLAPRDAQGRPSGTGKTTGAVGQVTSASEGSVSASMADVAKGAGASASWYAQTTYGFTFWQATSQYRTARYLPNPTMMPSSIFPLFPMGITNRGGGWR